MTTEWRFLFFKWYAVWDSFENPWQIVQPGIEIECDETYLSWFDIKGKSNGNTEAWDNWTEFMGWCVQVILVCEL